MRLLLSIFAFFILSFSAVWAQSDSDGFAIRVFGGTDTEAPTTPTLISATPVATTQVDVVWSAATDNFLVSGYVVYQDAVPIATTTLTSYSALGLTASTSYTYFVKAFDASFNYSSSSNAIVAITLANPTPEEEADSGANGTVTRVVLDELLVTPGVSTSTFFIRTKFPARFEIRWGRNDAYELGYTVHDHFVKTYKTTLTDLEPGTVYEYEVIGYTPYGKPTLLKRGQFTTLGFADLYPPANVNRFVAVEEGDDVRLRWQLPISDSISYVRIVRSHLGFPTYLQDGAIVYQGTAAQATDEGVLREFSPVYYTAFVVDKNGTVSSGAVALVYAHGGVGDGAVVPPTLPDSGGAVHSPLPDTVASTSPTLPPQTRMPDLSEIYLLQAMRRVSFAQAEPTLDSMTSFVVSIPKGAVSEHMKTIIVSITDPTNAKQSSSFLLRLNKDKTAYEAVVSALELEGMSRIIVDIYDYQSAVVGTYEKTVAFKDLTPNAPQPLFLGLFTGDITLLIALIAIPVLLALLIILFYRRRKYTKE